MSTRINAVAVIEDAIVVPARNLTAVYNDALSTSESIRSRNISFASMGKVASDVAVPTYNDPTTFKLFAADHFVCSGSYDTLVDVARFIRSIGAVDINLI